MICDFSSMENAIMIFYKASTNETTYVCDIKTSRCNSSSQSPNLELKSGVNLIWSHKLDFYIKIVYAYVSHLTVKNSMGHFLKVWRDGNRKVTPKLGEGSTRSEFNTKICIIVIRDWGRYQK